MPDGSDPWRVVFIIIILIILTLINGFFASAEIAIVSVRKERIKKLVSENNKKAIKLSKLTEQPTKFLSTIQVAITLAGYLSSATAGTQLSGSVVYLFQKINIVIHPNIAMIIVTLILSYFSLVVGELVPKRLALRSPERVAFRSVGVINFLMVILEPFVRFLTASTNFVLRLFGVKKQSEEEKVSEDEIRSLIVTGHIEGLIDEEEKDMIDSIFRFDDLEAESIMTPRTNILAIDIEKNFNNQVDKIINSGFSRFPVFKGDKDNIIGIIHIKDLLKAAKDVGFEKIKLSKLMRKPYFAPSHIKINLLFKIMKKTNNHIAILIDEYGGSLGIVTMEDLIEEIVGNIYDEHDALDNSIVKIGEYQYIISAAIPIQDLNRSLKLDIDEDNDEFDTLGGLMISELGYIPKENNHDEIVYNNFTLKTHQVSNNRIDKVLLEIISEPENHNIEID